MTETIAEQIVAAVTTRLASLTKANGYQFDAADVVRPKRHGGYTPTDLQLIVTQGAMTRKPESDHPGNPPAIAWESEVVVAGELMPDKDASTAIDTWRHRMAASIQKCLTSVSNWHNWGGLAINSELADPEMDAQDDGGSATVKVPVLITFRVSETDPYTARA